VQGPFAAPRGSLARGWATARGEFRPDGPQQAASPRAAGLPRHAAAPSPSLRLGQPSASSILGPDVGQPRESLRPGRAGASTSLGPGQHSTQDLEGAIAVSAAPPPTGAAQRPPGAPPRPSGGVSAAPQGGIATAGSLGAAAPEEPAALPPQAAGSASRAGSKGSASRADAAAAAVAARVQRSRRPPAQALQAGAVAELASMVVAVSQAPGERAEVPARRGHEEDGEASDLEEEELPQQEPPSNPVVLEYFRQRWKGVEAQAVEADREFAAVGRGGNARRGAVAAAPAEDDVQVRTLWDRRGSIRKEYHNVKRGAELPKEAMRALGQVLEAASGVHDPGAWGVASTSFSYEGTARGRLAVPGGDGSLPRSGRNLEELMEAATTLGWSPEAVSKRALSGGFRTRSPKRAASKASSRSGAPPPLAFLAASDGERAPRSARRRRRQPRGRPRWRGRGGAASASDDGCRSEPAPAWGARDDSLLGYQRFQKARSRLGGHSDVQPGGVLEVARHRTGGQQGAQRGSAPAAHLRDLINRSWRSHEVDALFKRLGTGSSYARTKGVFSFMSDMAVNDSQDIAQRQRLLQAGAAEHAPPSEDEARSRKRCGMPAPAEAWHGLQHLEAARARALVQEVRQALLLEHGSYGDAWKALTHGGGNRQRLQKPRLARALVQLGFRHEAADAVVRYALHLRGVHLSVIRELTRHDFMALLRSTEPVTSLENLRKRLTSKYGSYQAAFLAHDADGLRALNTRQFAHLCISIGGTLKDASQLFHQIAEYDGELTEAEDARFSLDAFSNSLRLAEGIDTIMLVRKRIIRNRRDPVEVFREIDESAVADLERALDPARLADALRDLALTRRGAERLVRVTYPQAHTSTVMLEDVLLRILGGVGKAHDRLAAAVRAQDGRLPFLSQLSAALERPPGPGSPRGGGPGSSLQGQPSGLELDSPTHAEKADARVAFAVTQLAAAAGQAVTVPMPQVIDSTRQRGLARLRKLGSSAAFQSSQSALALLEATGVEPHVKMTCAEFAGALKRGADLGLKACRELFAAVDEAETGSCSLLDLVEAARRARPVETLRQLRHLLRRRGAGGTDPVLAFRSSLGVNGAVSVEAWSRWLDGFGIHEDDARSLFRLMDTRGDGSVGLDQFEDGMFSESLPTPRGRSSSVEGRVNKREVSHLRGRLAEERGRKLLAALQVRNPDEELGIDEVKRAFFNVGLSPADAASVFNMATKPHAVRVTSVQELLVLVQQLSRGQATRAAFLHAAPSIPSASLRGIGNMECPRYKHLPFEWALSIAPPPPPRAPMPSLIASCAGLCLLGCAAGLECPLAMNTGAVGSCKFWGCSASRGPTHCTLGSCYCNEGYCRYPASTMHIKSRYCVARVPDATCHLTRFCYSAGLTTSFCEKGLCMCKWGYKAETDEDGKHACVPATAALAEAVARNATTEEIELLMEHKEHSESMAAQNVAVGAAWLCGAVALAFVAGAGALRRRASRVAAQPAGYQDTDNIKIEYKGPAEPSAPLGSPRVRRLLVTRGSAEGAAPQPGAERLPAEGLDLEVEGTRGGAPSGGKGAAELPKLSLPQKAPGAVPGGQGAHVKSHRALPALGPVVGLGALSVGSRSARLPLSRAEPAAGASRNSAEGRRQRVQEWQQVVLPALVPAGAGPRRGGPR
ncbi:unnamed protein product, partial [Prorocentrum cordatum]